MTRVRIAPSPTGSPHVGTAYNALLNWAWARRNKGRFIVRIEDTDRKRYVPEAEAELFDFLKWLGLKPDEGPGFGGDFGPYRQSERLELYQKYVRQLVEEGAAYFCDCSPERLAEMRQKQQKQGQPPRYDGKCRERGLKAGVVRLKVPQEGETIFRDGIRGEIRVQSSLVNDQVLLKSDGYPTYHLGVVVDDHLMGITDIIRGEEWLSSVPKHILLYQALGWEVPKFYHTPILRGSKREKLGKRFGHSKLAWFREQGFLPEALLNYLSLLGWSHPEEKEVFSKEEFVEVFDPKDLSAVGPVFDLEKLKWMNGVYVRRLSVGDLSSKLKVQNAKLAKIDGEFLKNVVPLVQERIKTLGEFWEVAGFFFEDIELSSADFEKAVVQKGRTIEETKQVLQEVAKLLGQVDKKAWKAGVLEEKLGRLMEKLGWSRRDFCMTIRGAVSGRKATPPLFEMLEVLGKEKVLSRLGHL